MYYIVWHRSFTPTFIYALLPYNFAVPSRKRWETITLDSAIWLISVNEWADVMQGEAWNGFIHWDLLVLAPLPSSWEGCAQTNLLEDERHEEKWKPRIIAYPCKVTLIWQMFWVLTNTHTHYFSACLPANSPGISLPVDFFWLQNSALPTDWADGTNWEINNLQE